MTEHAATWARVSTGAQDEASQVPDLMTWCESHGYDVTERYVVHGASAFHGKQARELDRVFADMAAGRFTVLVVWAADRIERRGALAALTLAERARVAGGRIEYVRDAHLNQANELSGTMLALAGDMARMESQRKSDRVKIKHAALRANGALVGRPPWGYVPAGERGARTLVPTVDGRRWVPEIFSLVIAGRSLAAVAAYLDAACVTPPTTAQRRSAATWGTHNVRDIVTCQTYTGRRTDATGAVILRCDALVSAETFSAANQAMAGRVRGGARGGVKRESAMLTGILLCAKCCGKMYRIGAREGFAGYYRCCADPRFGGVRRSECANMIKVTDMDAAARAMVARVSDPVMRPEWVAGDDSAAQLAEVVADIAAVQAEYAAGSIDLAAMVSKLTALDARKVELSAREPQPGRYVMVPTGETYGALAASLDAAGFRELLNGKAWIYADAATFPRMGFNAIVPTADGSEVVATQTGPTPYQQSLAA